MDSNVKSKYFITGATGLLGAGIVEHLSANNQEVTVYVRDEEKAKKMFSHIGGLSVVAGSLENGINYDGDVDYIVHAAAPTSSSFFIEHPVETIDSIVLGTKSVLEFAKNKKPKSVVYLSSMEVYGAPTQEEELTEDRQFYIDPLTVRSNYPLSKRLTENMCVAYVAEYGVPVRIARIAQVIGRNILPDDRRVVAEFIRAAKNGTDIQIATDGMTKQTYIDIEDTISGILTILDRGKDGEAYNVANDESYCSIRELAEKVANEIAGGTIDVMTNTDPDTAKYPPNRTLRLDSTKLRMLGWEPKVGLTQSLSELTKNYSG